MIYFAPTSPLQRLPKPLRIVPISGKKTRERYINKFKLKILKIKREIICTCLGSFPRASCSAGITRGTYCDAVLTSKRIRPGLTVQYQ